MKILHLTGVASGGMKEYILTLLSGLKDRGYHLHLAGPVGKWEDPRLEGIACFPLHIGPRMGISDILSVWRVFTKLRQDHMDAIHAHGYRAGIIAHLAGSLTGTRVIITLHNNLPPGHSWRRLVYLAGEKYLSSWPAEYVAVSQALKNQFTHILQIPSLRIKVIPPGLNWASRLPKDKPSVSVRQGLRLSATDPVVITLARLTPPKGIQYLLQAMAQLNKKIPALKLVVCGEGPYQGILKDLATKLGLGSRVIFTGYRQDVLELVRVADAFVLPSLSEGMPISILEAMALGKPVIATRVGGIPEIIEDGVTGWLVYPGDSSGISASLSKIFASPQEGVIMGQRAKSKILEKYTADIMVNQWDKLYKKEVADVAREGIPFEAR